DPPAQTRVKLDDLLHRFAVRGKCKRSGLTQGLPGIPSCGMPARLQAVELEVIDTSATRRQPASTKAGAAQRNFRALSLTAQSKAVCFVSAFITELGALFLRPMGSVGVECELGKALPDAA